MSMLKRLLGSLHRAVFDTSPVSAVAFFIRHADGVSWSVADDRLVATVTNYSKSYDLSQLTLGQLAGQLVIDGFEVSGLSAELAGLSASVLLEGDGNTQQSNGDRLFAFKDDLLRSLFGGYARELRTAKAQIPEALKQMVITTSENEWLDLWGALYNVKRKAGVSDADYAPLIPKEAFRLRVNSYGIEQAILDETGYRVHIEEPWSDMFRLDMSKLSSTHKFYDGSSVGYHLIRPVADKAIMWDGIIDIIERNKAAGVIVLPPEERNRTYLRDPLAGAFWIQMSALWSRWVKPNRSYRLDETLSLSNTTIERNYKASITSLQILSSVCHLNGIFLPASLSHILGFGPAIYPQEYQVKPYHTGFFRPTLIQTYPDIRKKWRGGGKWVGYQTWGRTYEWQIKSRMTSLHSHFFVDATVDGSIISFATQGADWTVPDSWNDMTWNGDAVQLQTWIGEPAWSDNSWEL